MRELERAVELKPEDPRDQTTTSATPSGGWAGGWRRAFQWQHALDSDPEEEEREKIQRKLEVGLEDESAPAARGSPRRRRGRRLSRLEIRPVTETLAAFAPAKVNLTLSVLGRREDGYHLLSSLVAFAEVGDDLTFAPGGALALSVGGPRAAALSADADNLVLKAARALAARVPDLRLGAFRLTKRLPVASGIGGGSADAAAALRLPRPRQRPRPRRSAGRRGGARDRRRRARVPRGAGVRDGGDRRAAAPRPALPGAADGPRQPRHPDRDARGVRARSPCRRARCATAPPTPEPSAEMSAGALIALLREAGNDLEAPATSLAPPIARLIDMVAGTPACRLARMSGSGATVFGLYESDAAAASAAARLSKARPGWWIVATRLGPAQEGPPTVRRAPIRAPRTASP